MTEIEICLLASGSGGNATLLSSDGTTVLIDAGLSSRELGRRMAAAGRSPESIDALVLTHGHNDHVRGAAIISRALGLRVYAGPASCASAGISPASPGVTGLEPPGFSVGALEFVPFAVPHDAEGTVGFRISDGRVAVGYATDLGSITDDVVSGMSECDALILESNHDERMLLGGPYPDFLKRRVRGPSGHLSNNEAAELLSCVRHPGLRHVALAHLSRTNNAPDLPLSAAGRALGHRASTSVSLGWQSRAGEVIRL